MFDLSNLYDVIDKVAPFCLSDKLIEKGDYDNSGIIIKTHDQVKSVLFSLDLSIAAVEKAKKLGADTVVTHHPAIYRPIKNLSVDDMTTAALIRAAKYGLNVISCHLNLDVAKGGIDCSLAEGLGGKQIRLIDELENGCGYGKEYLLNTTFSELKKRIKDIFKTDKILVYPAGKTVGVCASFCGGGSEYALSYVKSGMTKADLIISSDIPHHVVKELTEYGKSIIILPHYCAEEYGFKKFYEKIALKLPEGVKADYFYDKRFI